MSTAAGCDLPKSPEAAGQIALHASVRLTPPDAPRDFEIAISAGLSNRFSNGFTPQRGIHSRSPLRERCEVHAAASRHSWGCRRRRATSAAFDCSTCEWVATSR